jgi:hypothetical protein
VIDWEELFEGLPPRSFVGWYHGDDAPEIELAALTEAEGAFGPGVALAVVPIYQMGWAPPGEAEITGKRYTAFVTVAAQPAMTPQAPS